MRQRVRFRMLDLDRLSVFDEAMTERSLRRAAPRRLQAAGQRAVASGQEARDA